MAEGSAQLGTSGWSYKDWVGPFYAEGTRASEMLAQYCRHFGVVELDSSFYGVPRPETVERWRKLMPPGFVMCPKLWQEITHNKFLVDCDAELGEYLESLTLLREHLGPIVIQFPYFRKASGIDIGAFEARLGPFLSSMRERFDGRLAVEVRNKTYLRASLFALLADHGAALIATDHSYMPAPAEFLERVDEWPDPGFAFLRLLGDRMGIERVTKTWEREVIDQSWRLSIWAEWIRAMQQRGDVYAFVNNHYAGHAPATVARLQAELATR